MIRVDTRVLWCMHACGLLPTMIRVDTRVLWCMHACGLLELTPEGVRNVCDTRQQLRKTMHDFAYDLTAEHIRRNERERTLRKPHWRYDYDQKWHRAYASQEQQHQRDGLERWRVARTLQKRRAVFVQRHY